MIFNVNPETAPMAIERIYVSPAKGGLQVEQAAVTVVAGCGIEGDRYFGCADEPGQSLSLIEAEEMEAFFRSCGREADFSLSRRNLVTRGVRLNALVGKVFTVGEVQLRGVELCEPCLGLGKILSTSAISPAGVVDRFLHRAGLRAEVIAGGVIARGAEVHVVPGGGMCVSPEGK
jgi:MOSC domain-containing protein YiiM